MRKEIIPYQEKFEIIIVNEKHFPFNVKETYTTDLEGLKAKYYQDALEEAAYKTMCDYSDFAY